MLQTEEGADPGNFQQLDALISPKLHWNNTRKGKPVQDHVQSTDTQWKPHTQSA